MIAPAFRNAAQGDFGVAYVSAVASAAGYFATVSARSMDDTGIDVEVADRSTGGFIRNPRVSIQVKTSMNFTLSATDVSVDLSVKNYDDLREPHVQVPRILVAVVVPRDADDWVEASEDQLAIRRCAYWCSLRGAPNVTTRYTTRVKLQRTDCFHVPQLKDLMLRIASGGLP